MFINSSSVACERSGVCALAVDHPKNKHTAPVKICTSFMKVGPPKRLALLNCGTERDTESEVEEHEGRGSCPVMGRVHIETGRLKQASRLQFAARWSGRESKRL